MVADVHGIESIAVGEPPPLMRLSWGSSHRACLDGHIGPPFVTTATHDPIIHRTLPMTRPSVEPTA